MVARPWGWDIPFMLANFGWRAVTSIVGATAVYFILFRKELGSLAARSPVPEVEQPDDDAAGAALLPVPPWVIAVIANAPNPAGQALLGRFFDGAILPIGLLAGALLPTVIAAIVFRLL
jgi:hypothetical protein